MSNLTNMWDPDTGELVVVTGPENFRAGLLPYHPDDKAKAALAAAPAVPTAVPEDSAPQADTSLPMTRDQIKDALTKGNIEFSGNASNKILYDLLVKSLRGFLETKGNGNIPEDADGPTLLKMLSGA